jgi:hypothetical protein
MIGLLLILLAFFGLAGGSSSDVPPVGPVTVEDPPTTSTDWTPVPPGTLQKIEVQREGGIAFQAYSFTIDDPAKLAELAALLPAELPQIGEPQGACADCWSYRFVFDYVDANEAVLREYDDANIPDSLQAFTAAINDYIGSGAVQPSEPDVN